MFRSSLFVRASLFGAISVFALALIAAPGTAEPVLRLAQYYPAYPPPPPAYGGIPLHEVDAVVRSLGLTPISRPHMFGPAIVVQAIGQEGTRVQVTLDSRSGRVMQIMRLGPGAPRLATVRPEPPRIYAAPHDGPDYFDEDDMAPLPPGSMPNGSVPNSGPQVITRGGIQSEELPPPGAGPRVIAREPEITGSVPRASGRASIDPLLGVPPEYRS